jgi:hypothetical protein
VFNIADVLTDAVTMADAPVFTFGDVQTDAVTMADAAAFALDDVQTDSITASDAAPVFNIADVQTDTVTMADAAPVFNIADVLTDDVTMADAVTFSYVPGVTTPLYDFTFMSDDKFTYFPVMGVLNAHLIHQPLINGEFVLTTDPNAGIVYTIRTESYSYMFAGYGLNENQLN